MSTPLHEHTLDHQPDRIRLLDYCLGLFPQLPTRNSVKKAIKRAELLHNGLPAEGKTWMQQGDTLSLLDLERYPPSAFRLALTVVWEDDYLAAVAKPAGLVVSGNQFRTLENALPNHLRPSTQPDALPRPRPVHRIDGPTSGLVLVAKTKGAHIGLGRMFEDRQIRKTYEAIVKGLCTGQGQVNSPVDGQAATSYYQAIDHTPSLRSGYLSLVRLQPHTGRTHQLRLHMAELGLPILGDKEHDDSKQTLSHKGLFLAATRLELQHPIHQQALDIQLAHPAKFDTLFERERRRWAKYHPESSTE